MRLVISGSSSLADKMKYWRDHLEESGYEILDWPKGIEESSFEESFPDVHRQFYAAIGKADMLFIPNEEKNGQAGYIGAGVFAEISFAMGLNFIRETKIKVLVLNRPSEESHFYEDITRWEKYEWLEIGRP